MQLKGCLSASARWSYDRAIVWRVLTASLFVLLCCSIPRSVRADVPVSQGLQHTANNLDGVYLMLGPLGALSYLDRVAQSTFGGQLVVLRVREQTPIATAGITFGALRYTTADRWRTFAELAIGTRVRSTHVGMGIGPVLEVDRVAPGKLGGQVTLWVFAGVIPYVRAGHIAGTGSFAEFGVQLMLPARRW